MADHETIQGAWRVGSYRAYGGDVATGTTHYVFDGLFPGHTVIVPVEPDKSFGEAYIAG